MSAFLSAFGGRPLLFPPGPGRESIFNAFEKGREEEVRWDGERVRVGRERKERNGKRAEKKDARHFLAASISCELIFQPPLDGQTQELMRLKERFRNQ